MTNAKYTGIQALQLGVPIDQADTAMAIIAAAYACENYYAPKIIADFQPLILAIIATAYTRENYYTPKIIADKVNGLQPLISQSI